MLFLFWNIREFSSIQYSVCGQNSYSSDKSYIFSKNQKYNFCEYFYDEMPFIFKKKDNFLFLIPVIKIIQNQIANVLQLTINDPQLLQYKKILDVINMHDGKYYQGEISINNKTKFISFITKNTSCLQNKHSITPLGSIYAAAHTNKKLSDSTHEVPVCYWEASNLQELDQFMKGITQIFNLPKFVSSDLPLNLDYQTALCVSNNQPTFTKAKKTLLDTVYIGIEKVKVDAQDNPHRATYGQYANCIKANDVQKGSIILNNIHAAVDDTFYRVRGVEQAKLLSKGIFPTEFRLQKETAYKQVLFSKTHIEETIKKQAEFKIFLHEELFAVLQNKQFFRVFSK